MFLRLFFVMALCVLICHQATATVPEGGHCYYVRTATFPISYEHALPSLSGKINGKDTSMLLDTAASETMLFQAAAPSLGLTRQFLGPYHKIDGSTDTAYRMVVDDMEVGPVHGHKVPFLMLANPVGGVAFGTILGLDFMIQERRAFGESGEQSLLMQSPSGSHGGDDTAAAVMRQSAKESVLKVPDFLLVPKIEGTTSFGAVLGADFLFQADMELSLREQKATFYSPVDCQDKFLAVWNKNALSVPMAEPNAEGTHLPLITVEVNGVPLRALINSTVEHTVIDVRGGG